MTDDRRIYVPGSTWFFAVNLANRSDGHLLLENIERLRKAFRYVKERKPFYTDAAVIFIVSGHCRQEILISPYAGI